MGRGTAGRGWVAPVVVVETAEAPVVVRTARPSSVGAGLVFVIVEERVAVGRIGSRIVLMTHFLVVASV